MCNSSKHTWQCAAPGLTCGPRDIHPLPRLHSCSVPSSQSWPGSKRTRGCATPRSTPGNALHPDSRVARGTFTLCLDSTAAQYPPRRAGPEVSAPGDVQLVEAHLAMRCTRTHVWPAGHSPFASTPQLLSTLLAELARK